jgi:hypothetical protein
MRAEGPGRRDAAHPTPQRVYDVIPQGGGDVTPWTKTTGSPEPVSWYGIGAPRTTSAGILSGPR